jgi:hypothetical protein
MSTKTVYISIGNSDDKLSQFAWNAFCGDMEGILLKYARQFHGNWSSASRDSFQNACWCVEPWPHMVDELKESLTALAGRYRQDSIAWAEATTEFLGATHA